MIPRKSLSSKAINHLILAKDTLSLTIAVFCRIRNRWMESGKPGKRDILLNACSFLLVERTVMKVLVTGAFGNVGRSTLMALAERGAEVTVLESDTPVNRSLAKRLASSLGVRGQPAFTRQVLGDIRDPSVAARAMEGQDAVIHLAAIIPPQADRFPDLAHEVNVGGTQALVDAALACPSSPRFVLASSISAYGDRVSDFWIRTSDPLAPSPGDRYGQTKVEAEALLRKSGLPFSILRLTYIVWRKKLGADPLMFHMPLATKIEICHTEDTGRAFAEAAANPAALGRTFDIGGGKSCRTDYYTYLDTMLGLFGLGGMRGIPLLAFAGSGFHCGWYADSDEAEGILSFRKNTLPDYYREVGEEARLSKIGATLLRPLIKSFLSARSPFLKG
jgi:nucleoside-diphosphate-sugar epimerase